MNVHVRFFTVAAFAALAALAGAAPLAAQSAPVASDDQSSAKAAAFAVPTALPDVPVRTPSNSITAPSDVPAPSTNRGPTLASARVATHVVSAPRGAPPVIQNRSSNRNAVALMAVGGAALVVGAVIGDDAGTIVMLGGAVIGLYGLYLFLT